ncbi:hypothetical protein [Streptomyces sp. H39-S7]|uniref:hypothetical protein n=1 Tax=Streptomyces sp. H39-S7 TaxID=3004357 RepID=UPI0022AFC8A9|nr:hypothetical protein [Streptomyces sp. H39-S7]MCZ4125957.1 hypothetical protein [Streptomyces sp. H39-S7]
MTAPAKGAAPEPARERQRWATARPPPRQGFVTLPEVRSESPAFDPHHPEVAAREGR